MFYASEFPNLACPPLRVVELFAGIGGLAAAWPEANMVAAFDINQQAQSVHTQNFDHTYYVREIESLSAETLTALGADCWWMSPPCQPFTRRGAKRDVHDPRCRGFLHIVDCLARVRPEVLGLENVIGFEESEALQTLLKQLHLLGYHVQSRALCPSQMGWPNQRPRFYLLASQRQLHRWRELPQSKGQLAELIDTQIVAGTVRANELMLRESDRLKYAEALDRVERSSLVTACFAGSYGKTIVRSGSYLQCGHSVRRFSPREVARLLGFNDTFGLEGLTDRAAWKLLGNSLSLLPVRYVLSHLM